MTASRAAALTTRAAMGLAAIWAVGLLIVFGLRMTFPLELEWMEGGVVHQALRVQQGQPIYAAPDAEFIPFLYTPLYSLVLAGLGTIFPLGPGLGRAISIAAWAATCAAMWRAVAREGKPKAHAAAAVGLFCSGYVFSFRWIDIARPDAMFLALLVWGLVLARESWGDHRKAILAGALIALAFWTKQTTAVFVLTSGLAVLLVAPRQIVTYALTIAAIDGVGVLLVNRATDGWLWTYIYDLHQAHAFNAERFTTKTWGMFIHALPLTAAAAVVSLGVVFRPWLEARRKLDSRGDEARRALLQANRGVAYWGLMAAAGLLVSALGYSTQWAEPNAFLPGVCLVSLWVAIAMPHRGLWAIVALGLVAAQMAFALVVEPQYQPIQDRGLAGVPGSYRWQDLSRTVPSAKQRAAAATLRDELKRGPDPVLALQRPWWTLVSGSPGHVGSMGLNDVPPEDRRRVVAALRTAVQDGTYARIYFEGEPPQWLRPALARAYRLQRRVVGDDRVRPMVGYMSEAGMVTPYRGAQLLFVPLAPREAPRGSEVVADFEGGTLGDIDVVGRAFGRRPVRGLPGRLPAVGPYGGEFYLSSATAAGRLEPTGSATLGPVVVPHGWRIAAWVGVTSTDANVRLELVAADEVQALARPPGPDPGHVLHPLSWEIPPGWADRPVHIRIVDDDPRGAIFVDDVWVLPPDADPGGTL